MISSVLTTTICCHPGSLADGWTKGKGDTTPISLYASALRLWAIDHLAKRARQSAGRQLSTVATVWKSRRDEWKMSVCDKSLDRDAAGDRRHWKSTRCHSSPTAARLRFSGRKKDQTR